LKSKIRKAKREELKRKGQIQKYEAR